MSRGQAASRQFLRRGDEIARRVNPRRATAGSRWRNVLAERNPIGEIRKIQAGGLADTRPRPDARIDVEQLVLPIARVALELKLDHAGEIQGARNFSDASATSGQSMVSTNVLV